MLLYMSTVSFSRSGTLESPQSAASSDRSRLIFSPSLRRRVDSLRGLILQTSHRGSRTLSPIASATNGPPSVSAPPGENVSPSASSPVRSGLTSSRVTAYLRALQRRFDLSALGSAPTANRRQGRSRQVTKDATDKTGREEDGEPVRNGKKRAESGHEAAEIGQKGAESGQKGADDGADREDRGILFFPGNVIHSFGIPPSASGEHRPVRVE